MAILTNRWAVLALLFFARTSMAMQFQSIPPIIPFLIEDLGINFTQVGLLIGLFFTPGIFLALPGGLLGQRFGDKAVVLTGLTVMTVGALLFANANSYSLAFAGRLLGGVGVVLLNVQSAKITADWFLGKEISTAMGILVTSFPLGIALALSTLGYVATAYSWQTAIYITATYSGISLLLFALLYSDPPTPEKASEPGSERPSLWSISKVELVLIVVAAMVWSLPNSGFIIYLSFTPALLVAGGMAVAQAGFTTGLASWISIGSIPMGGWLTDRTGRVNLFIVTGCTMSALVVWLLPVGGSILVWVILFGVAAGGWPGAIMALPGQVLSSTGRSTGFGVFYTVSYLGMAAFPPIAGWLRDSTGTATASVLFGGLLLALTIIALSVFRLLQRRLFVEGNLAPETTS